jgi:hypothetical protein
MCFEIKSTFSDRRNTDCISFCFEAYLAVPRTLACFTFVFLDICQIFFQSLHNLAVFGGPKKDVINIQLL